MSPLGIVFFDIDGTLLTGTSSACVSRCSHAAVTASFRREPGTAAFPDLSNKAC